MPKAYKGPHSLVLASVKPGEFGHPSLNAAASLCKRTGMRLRLVAAIEPAEVNNLHLQPSDMYDFTAMIRSESAELKAQVEDELQRFANTLELDIKVETSVVIGTPAQVILSEAVVSGASLIVTGAAKGSLRFIPKGLSTALTLMSESPIPVLVINDNRQLNLNRKALDILVADDLSESCERAVLVGFDLAIALGETDVHHIYVNSLTMENFAHNVQKLRELRKEDVGAHISPTELWEETHRSLHTRIRLRAPGRTQFLETAGGHYWPEIRDGGIKLGLEKAIDIATPDVIVFGRHQTIHRRPFSIGRVPFHFMLSMDYSILVVPPT